MTKTQLNAGDKTHISGVRLSALASGIRYEGRLDLVLIEIPEQATLAGVLSPAFNCVFVIGVAVVCRFYESRKCAKIICRIGR